VHKTTVAPTRNGRAPASAAPWIAGTAAFVAVAIVLVAIVHSRSTIPRQTGVQQEAEEEAPPALEAIAPGAPAARPAAPVVPRAVAVDPPLSVPAPQAVPPPAPAATAVEIREKHRVALDQHAREPADSRWAQEMSAIVGTGLKTGATKGQFRVLDVDCRSRTCVASVEWESASTAYRQWKTLLGATYGQCGVEVVLDEPVDSNARFSTKVLFPCANQE
jgi:type IV secretory pathway VirB10-like protein